MSIIESIIISLKDPATQSLLAIAGICIPFQFRAFDKIYKHIDDNMKMLDKLNDEKNKVLLTKLESFHKDFDTFKSTFLVGYQENNKLQNELLQKIIDDKINCHIYEEKLEINNVNNKLLNIEKDMKNMDSKLSDILNNMK